jgi:hypothetical protein
MMEMEMKMEMEMEMTCRGERKHGYYTSMNLGGLKQVDEALCESA